MEWYRNRNWDLNIKSIFEEKLKKARGTFNKAEYLKIQGGTLLWSDDLLIQQEGIRLLERVSNEYSNEASSAASSLEILAEYYFNLNDLAKSEECYLSVLKFYEIDRNATSGLSEIHLAELYLLINDIEKNKMIYKILKDNFNKMSDFLVLDEDKFKYYKVLAFLANKINKEKEAKKYAKEAIRIFETNNQFSTKFNKNELINVVADLKKI